MNTDTALIGYLGLLNETYGQLDNINIEDLNFTDAVGINLTATNGYITNITASGVSGATGQFNSMTVYSNLTGPSGYIGTLGVNSITGPTGRFNSLTVNTNLTGPSGFIGTLGVNSITGPTGQFNSMTINTNLTGPSGFIGTLGVNSITGPTGRFNSMTINTNLTGPSGFIGTLGVNSITGPTGQFNSLTVNTNLTGPSGFVGTLGVNSITGPTGRFNSLTVNNDVTLSARTASKILLTDPSKIITSSLYNDTDFGRLAATQTWTGVQNTFDGNLLLTARTANKFLQTNASKQVVSGSYSESDCAILSLSNTFTGTTNTFNNAINLPARTASKLLLTDASKNITSSTLNDTDLPTLAGSNTFTGTTNTFNDIVLNNTRISLGSTQTTTSLTTGCLIGSNLSNGGFNNVNMINGTGTLITAAGTNRTYISQLRNVQLNAGLVLYDNTTKEISYSATVPTFTTSGLTITGLTASRIVRTDGSKLLSSCAFDTTEIVLNNQSNTYTTGQQIFNLGTVSAPSISFTGDLNTGIFSAGADTVNLTTNATTRLSVSNSGVNIPSLNSSKLVLTDASDNLISSSYTDTDILNNKMIETCTAPLSLLTFTNQQAFYCPIYVDKSQTFSSIYFGFNIPAGATNLNPYMGLATLAVYNTSSLTGTHPNFISSTVGTKVTASDTGEIGLFLINNPSTKSYNTMYKHTYSSSFTLSAGRYFLALLMESAAPATYIGALQASFTSNSASMNITAFNLDTISVTAGSVTVLAAPLNHSASTSFTYNVSGTSLSITSTPTPYYVFPGCYLNSISGGLYIVSQSSGTTGAVGLYVLSSSVSTGSGTATVSSSRYTATVNSLGTATGRTGTYNMSAIFAPISVGSITASSSSIDFTHTAATTASYVPLGVTTSNSYNYQQAAITSLPSTATPAASTSMPYMALST